MFKRVYKRFIKCLFKIMPGFKIRVLLMRSAGYSVGKDVFVGEDLIIIDELEDWNMVRIGNRVAISGRVTLVVSSNPNVSKIAPFVRKEHGPIEIADDAWIGTGSIIFPNIRIGRGAVVGAGAVVIKNVPDFTVVVGVPAKPLRRLNVGGRL
jgi:maltose O-acetyltransferase